jgi:hypothetical protein
VLNRTLSFSQAQTCFACVQGKSPGPSTVAGGEEMLVAGAWFEPAKSGDPYALEASSLQYEGFNYSIGSIRSKISIGSSALGAPNSTPTDPSSTLN